MEGEVAKPLTIQNQLNELEVLLDSYETKANIPVVKHDESVDYYMNLTREEMRRLTPEDLAEGYYILGKYSYYITKLTNKHVAVANWCASQITGVISKSIQDYQWSFDEKKMCAIRDNEVATKLEKVRVLAQAHVDRLAYLANSIKFVASSLDSLKYVKMQHNQRQ